MANYIVLRDSPDWPALNAETARQFFLASGLPEKTIFEFIRVWNRVSRIDYRAFRHRLKLLSLDNYRAVEDATVIPHREFRGIAVTPDDLVLFTGDDNWLAPDLFARVREAMNDDGAVWGSIRIGVIFSTAPRVVPDVYHERPFTSRLLYTNNYGATGKALVRVGIDCLLEQPAAQKELARGNFRPKLVVDYLSCAVKHPACEAAALEYMASESFRADPKRAFANTAEDIARINPIPWARGPLKAMTQLIVAALG